MVLVSVTFSNPWPEFQGRSIFEIQYVKNSAR